MQNAAVSPLWRIAKATSVLVALIVVGLLVARPSMGLFVTWKLVVPVVPLLLLIAHLGSFADQRNNSVYAVSGAYVTPVLDALEIQYRLVETGDNLEICIKDAARHTQALKLPVALLFSGDFTR